MAQAQLPAAQRAGTGCRYRAERRAAPCCESPKHYQRQPEAAGLRAGALPRKLAVRSRAPAQKTVRRRHSSLGVLSPDNSTDSRPALLSCSLLCLHPETAPLRAELEGTARTPRPLVCHHGATDEPDEHGHVHGLHGHARLDACAASTLFRTCSPKRCKQLEKLVQARPAKARAAPQL